MYRIDREEDYTELMPVCACGAQLDNAFEDTCPDCEKKYKEFRKYFFESCGESEFDFDFWFYSAYNRLYFAPVLCTDGFEIDSYFLEFLTVRYWNFTEEMKKYTTNNGLEFELLILDSDKLIRMFNF